MASPNINSDNSELEIANSLATCDLPIPFLWSSSKTFDNTCDTSRGASSAPWFDHSSQSECTKIDTPSHLTWQPREVGEREPPQKPSRTFSVVLDRNSLGIF